MVQHTLCGGVWICCPSVWNAEAEVPNDRGGCQPFSFRQSERRLPSSGVIDTVVAYAYLNVRNNVCSYVCVYIYIYIYCIILCVCAQLQYIQHCTTSPWCLFVSANFSLSDEGDGKFSLVLVSGDFAAASCSSQAF